MFFFVLGYTWEYQQPKLCATMNYIQQFVKAHTEARRGVTVIEEILKELEPGPEKTALSIAFEDLETRMLDLSAFGQELECNKALWIETERKSRKRKYGE